MAPSMGCAFARLSKQKGSGNLLPGPASSNLLASEKRPWWIAAAALFFLSMLLIGLKLHLQAWDLQTQVATLEAELAPLESLAQKVTVAHEEYVTLTAKASVKSELLERRRYWVAFLADLQARLNEVQDVWLESIAAEESNGSDAVRRLRVTGSLLDRENPLSAVSSNSRGRVEVLLGSFESSPFIQSVEDRRFDTSQPGILQFDFSLVVQPKGVF